MSDPEGAEQPSQSEDSNHLKGMLRHAFETIERRYRVAENSATAPKRPLIADDAQLADILVPGTLTLIMGPPGIGKMALALEIVHALVRQDCPVLVVPTATPSDDIVFRLVGKYLVSPERLATGRLDDEDWGNISHAMSNLIKLPLQIRRAQRPLVESIAEIIRATLNEHVAKLVVVDLLQVPAGHDAADLARQLKGLAEALDTAIMLRSMTPPPWGILTRRLQTSASALSRLGALANAVDVVLCPTRRSYWSQSNFGSHSAELLIAKQRGAPSRRIKMTFSESTCSYSLPDSGQASVETN